MESPATPLEKSAADIAAIIAARMYRRIIGSIALEIYFKELSVSQYQHFVAIEQMSVPATTFEEPEYSDTDDDVEFVLETPKAPHVPRRCICSNISSKNKVCVRDVCTFAHTLCEWEPDQCKFGKKCKSIDKCQRLHGRSDTKEKAIERLKITFLSDKKYVKTRMHLKRFLTDKS